MRITGGSVFDLEHGFCEKDLCTDGSVFAGTSSDGEIVDASGCYVIPGLVDVHFHGCVGEDFSDATPEGLQAMADYELSEGVAYICPAGMTLQSWWASIWKARSFPAQKREPRTATSCMIPMCPC